MNIIKQFWGTIAFTFLSLIVAFCLGWSEGGLSVALSALFIVSVLAVIELSLSFDNSVIQAKILKNWDTVWRTVFLTAGLLVAVVGARLIIPILIVSTTSGLSFIESFTLAFTDTVEYGHKLHDVHHLVAGAGGSFLLMVALDFFFNSKEVHWFGWLERKLEKFGELESFSVIFTLLVAYVLSYFTKDPSAFFAASFGGVATYVVVHILAHLAGDINDTGSRVIKGSVGGFLFLEALDIFYSIDGIFAGLAISNNILYVMLGLGIGAAGIRSFTVYMVNDGTLDQLKYLEHGAFYSITVLVMIMFASGVGVVVPEVLSGTLCAGVIGLSIWHSIKERRQLLLEND